MKKSIVLAALTVTLILPATARAADTPAASCNWSAYGSNPVTPGFNAFNWGVGITYWYPTTSKNCIGPIAGNNSNQQSLVYSNLQSAWGIFGT